MTTDSPAGWPEYLVQITVNWPADGDPVRRDELIAREGQRAAELASAGIIRRLWRVPGRWANVGVWAAPSPGALHDAISSLPFFPWLAVTVQALAPHPSDLRSND